MFKLYIPKTKNVFLIYFVAFVVLPCLILVCIFYNRIFSTLEQQTQKAHVEVVNQANLSLQNQLAQLYTSINFFTNDPELQALLKYNDFKTLDSNLHRTYDELTTLLNESLLFHNALQDLVIMPRSGGFYFSRSSQLVTHNPYLDLWAEKTRLTNGGICWLGYTNFSSNSPNLLVLSKQILDRSTFQELGIAYFTFNPSFLSASINNYFSTDCSSYLLTYNNECLWSESSISFDQLPPEILQENTKSLTATFTFDQQDYIALSSSLNQYNLKLLTLYPTQLYSRELHSVSYFFIFTLVLFLLSFLIIGFLLYKWLIIPIENLCNLFTDTDQPIPVHSQLFTYEFRHIGNGIISLLKSSSEKKQEILKLTQDRTKYQLDCIQAQINPHFLYNTLTSIKYLALKNRNQEVATLITSLVKLLRSSINRDGDFISVKKELENLRYYVAIQQVFYAQVTFVFDIDTSLESLIIPNFILQPLVENSLFHGIDPNAPQGKITVSCYQKESTLIFEVHDNGRGFDSTKLHTFNNAFHNQGTVPFSNMGIKNIDEKIKLLCGQGYGLTIISSENIETLIRVVLPKQTLHEVNSNE